ncbi:MAG: hypothetical protein OHK93_007237 [Ramalina farinacea]|uniref:Metallo-beta-lactamase domain-containing protein n=1 Tax=Ramalina farinacea TaxID=258253 RepID=A0AA43QK34_9LECA|nr:hypothetical protein [Ramalina farinacea]
MTANLPVKVTKFRGRPSPSTTAHHVGSPPTSFKNPWPSFVQPTRLELLGTSFHRPPFIPVPSRDKLVSIQKPDWGIDRDELKATWIGHATFLVETPRIGSAGRGIRILFDPVFSERTSPVSFIGPKRYTPTPCTIDELPDVDIIAISHDHYDHMDSDTLLKIWTKRKEGVHILVGLGSASRIRGFGISAASVTELDWWERVRIEVPGLDPVTLTCTPTQHFSGRGIMDHGSTLWCSWVLEAGNQGDDATHEDDTKKLFFAGDTGYRHVPKDADESDMAHCPAFKEIGEAFGPFDLCMLPIGLYSPRHLLSSLHCTPEDALCLHKDLKSKKSVGMHYGTVRGGLSQYFEDVTDPPRRFREVCENERMRWGEELLLIGVGQTIHV